MVPIGCPKTSRICYQPSPRSVPEERWSLLILGGNLIPRNEETVHESGLKAQMKHKSYGIWLWYSAYIITATFTTNCTCASRIWLRVTRN